MRLAACLVLSVLGSQAMAQPPAPACVPDAHRQFDFWLGDWEVRVRDSGKLAGHNTIRRTVDGCVLHESYTTPGKYRGESLNAYDATRGVWHQTWMDNGGLVLVLEGRFQDGRMVLSGETQGPDGKVTLNRITWTPESDGTVRQHWETSADSGRTWTTAFDGVYTRRGGGDPEPAKLAPRTRTVL